MEKDREGRMGGAENGGGNVPTGNRRPSGKGGKRKNAVLAAALVAVVLVVCVTVYVVRLFMPSKEIMELTEYYKVPDDRVKIVLQDEVTEEFGLYQDKVAYVDFNLVKERMNKRFFWDANENLLLYTTPNEVVKVGLDSTEYVVAKSKAAESYVIVKMLEGKIFVAMDFVKKYSNVEYQVYEQPNRIVIRCDWGQDFLYADVKKGTQLRFEPSIKADILEQLQPGNKLFVDTSEDVPKGFVRAVTETGVVGYVRSKHLGESYFENLTNDYKEEVYTHIEKEGKINLVWHQVTNADANGSLLEQLNATKGVTVVSPTWFSLSDNEGNISSLASEKYVQRAHEAGVEVWALCDDFNENMTVGKVLGYTSKREKLANELLAAAIKYGLDGINIDFEYIKEEGGEDFVQFLRELSVKCRQNGIVLSVDNYVPSDMREHYDREEQGIVVDYVITMAYDEHYPGGGESGSVSSLGFVTEAVRRTVEQIPPERNIIALPFYTRLWKEKEGEDGVKVTAEAYGMDTADNVLREHGVEPQWDAETGQYYAEFRKGGAMHRIWLEEETSLEEKLKVVMEQDVAGVAFWKLGLQRESVWDVVTKYLNQGQE